MSRTRKGSKGPGWEPWSNRDQKAEQKADYMEPSKPSKPLVLGIYIRFAETAEDANRQCKRTQAYRSILRDYPSAEWVTTRRHNTGPAGTPTPEGPGAWLVEFEVQPKP